MNLSKDQKNYIRNKYGMRVHMEYNNDTNLEIYNLSSGFSAWEFRDHIDIFNETGLVETIRNMSFEEFDQHLEKTYGAIKKYASNLYKLGSEYEMEYSPELISIYKITPNNKELIETFNPNDFYWESRLSCD